MSSDLHKRGLVISNEFFFWEGRYIASRPSDYHKIFEDDEVGKPAIDSEAGEFILTLDFVDVEFAGSP